MQHIGLIGAGSYGARHAEAIVTLDNAKLVAANRTNEAALNEFVERYSGVGYTDYKDLLADASVDAVVIATPHDLHTDIVIESIRAGKHILLEKPMAPTLDECRRMLQAAQDSPIKMMVGHVNHFAPAYQVAKELIESGEMGEVIMGTATMQKYWFEPNRRGWHLDRDTGGGVWLTVGIHALDRLTWLIDSPVTGVSAQFATRFHDQQADDVGLVFLRYANGAAGSIVSTGYSMGAPKHLTELTCTRGMVNIDYTGGVMIGRDEEWRLIPESRPGDDWMHDALVNEWRAFLHSIETDTPSPVTAEFAFHIMDVIFAAEQSSRVQQEIKVASTWQI
jgi:predicted dehydrogenase